MKKEFHTKLAGVTKRNDDEDKIQDLLKDISECCYEGELLSLEHESDNVYDENAIKVFYGFDHIGYIKRDLAKELAPLVDQQRVEAELCEITGGEDGKSFGCNILIRVVPEGETARTDSRKYAHIGKINPTVSTESKSMEETAKKIVCPEKVEASYLKSVEDADFRKWSNEYLKWAENLPTDIDEETKRQVQEQIDIINLESNRRKTGVSYFDGTVLQHFGYSLLAGMFIAITFGIGAPWAYCGLHRWETEHTVINSKRLEFDGKGLQLFLLSIKFIFFTIITFGIYVFWVPVRLNQWVVSHTHFETPIPSSVPAAAPQAVQAE